MRSSAAETRALLGLTVGAFAARLLYGSLYPPRWHNTDAYADIAASFARAGVLAHADGRITADREPFYPILLGIFYKLFGEGQNTTLWLNCLLGAAAVWALHRAAREVFDARAAWVAAVLAAVYPQFIFYAKEPVRETLLVLLAVLTVWAVWRAAKAAGPLAPALAGAAAAAMLLTNTQYIAWACAGAPAALLWLGRAELKRAVKRAAIYLTVFVSLYGLWPLRNYLVFDTFVLGSNAAGGYLFYIYQKVPQELGGTQVESDIIRDDPVLQSIAHITDPAQRQHLLWRAGLEHARENPLRFAKLFFWRLLWDQWRLVPRERAYTHDFRKVWWAGALSDGWIIPLGFAMMLVTRLRPPPLAVVPIFLLSAGLVTAPILTIIRYRLPCMPWLIALAAAGLVALWDKARASTR